MSADFRHMKCPRQTWFLVYTVPPDLRGHPRFMTSNGRPMDKITESLGTKDPDKARENRNQRIAYWDKQFHILRHGPSEDDIIEEAAEIYKAALRANEVKQRSRHLDIIFGNDETTAAVRLQEKAEAEALLDHPDQVYPLLLDRAIELQATAEIVDYCQRAGIILEPRTEPYRNVGIRFIKAKIAAGVRDSYLPLPDGREIRGSEQHLPPLPKIEAPIPAEPKPITDPLPTRKGAETFADAAVIYLKNELADDVKPATVAEYQRKIDAFPHKDKPLRTITRGMAADFLDGLPISKRTRNLYAALFSAIYTSAIRRERATANPFEGQRLKGVAQVHYEAFTDQELATLFADAKFEIAPDKHTTATALPWVSLIAAFTGCRREEIASLMASDIKRTDGVWFFDIRDGKTDNAERVVPIHHALIDAGLFKYRDALPPGSRLFPGLKARASKDGKLGGSLGDAFEAWRKRLGIVRKGVNFHSFRHTAGDRLRKAGVAKDDRGFLLGHADVEMQNKVYGHNGPGLYRLQAIVEKIDYQGGPLARPARPARAGTAAAAR
jgi:integrase